MRPQRAHFQGLNRQLQIVDRAGGGGKVKDKIYVSLHGDKFGYIVPQITEPFFRLQIVQIPFIPRQKIINRQNLVPLFEKSIHQMGPEEPRTSRDNANWHILS